MDAKILAVLGQTSGEQQKDNLCGPFWATRVLNESGFLTLDGKPVDQDLMAFRARTVLPEPHEGLDVPRGAEPKTGYEYALPTGPVEKSGTSAVRLAQAIEAASLGGLTCVPVRGAWSEGRVEILVAAAPDLGARLIANLRTGRLWGSRPAVETILAELAGEQVEGPQADWDVGHFVELEMLIRGPRGSLVVVHDSYPSLGWGGRHLQPARAVSNALLRGDGREGGVLVVVPKAKEVAVKGLATEFGLDVATWNNGTGS